MDHIRAKMSGAIVSLIGGNAYRLPAVHLYNKKYDTHQKLYK